MTEWFTPPQGLIAISDQKVIYGLPCSLPVGSAMKVDVRLPPVMSYCSALKVSVIGGDYQPLGELQVVTEGHYTFKPASKLTAKPVDATLSLQKALLSVKVPPENFVQVLMKSSAPSVSKI